MNNGREHFTSVELKSVEKFKGYGVDRFCAEYSVGGIIVEDEREFLKYLMPYVNEPCFIFTNRTDFYGFDDEDTFIDGYDAFCRFYSDKEWMWFSMCCRTKPGKYPLNHISLKVEPESLTVKADCRHREGLVELERALQAAADAFNDDVGEARWKQYEQEKEDIAMSCVYASPEIMRQQGSDSAGLSYPFTQAVLDEDDEIGIDSDTTVQFCKRCGKAIPLIFRYCGYCGFDLREGGELPVQNAPMGCVYASPSVMRSLKGLFKKGRR